MKTLKELEKEKEELLKEEMKLERKIRNRRSKEQFMYASLMIVAMVIMPKFKVEDAVNGFITFVIVMIVISIMYILMLGIMYVLIYPIAEDKLEEVKRKILDIDNSIKNKYYINEAKRHYISPRYN